MKQAKQDVQDALKQCSFASLYIKANHFTAKYFHDSDCEHRRYF